MRVKQPKKGEFTLRRGKGWFEYLIAVRQTHMTEGVPGDEENCPIALAIKEQMRERSLIDVRVYCDGIRIRLPSGDWWTGMPKLEWVRLYDRGIMTKPESFIVRWTSESN